jgi:uncharacterized protein
MSTMVSNQPDERLLADLVDRITGAVRPLRIILFGSASRGHMHADSDLDVLVVMPDGTHRRNTARTLYTCLRGIGVPKDIVVVTEGDVRNHADNPSLVLYPALRQGRELWHAPE